MTTIDTHRSPTTPENRKAWLPRRWLKRRRERLDAKWREWEIHTRHRDLDAAADSLVDDYTDAVTAGWDRNHLSAILTGISGTLLARSSCWYAQGCSAEAEQDRLSGLLLGEVAACASENPFVSGPLPYRGPRSPEFAHPGYTSDALYDLAAAYWAPKLEDEELVVWGCLSGVIEAVVETAPVMPGTWPGPVIVAWMCDAHFSIEHPARVETVEEAR